MWIGKISLIAAAAVLAASASPAAAQGNGVDCVANAIGTAKLESLSAGYFSKQIDLAKVDEELGPGVQSCIDRGVIVTQPQVDASFLYVVSMIEKIDYRKDLQNNGVDAAQVEALWSSMPAPLKNSVVTYVVDRAEVPEEGLKTYLSANSTADEKGKLGTAVVLMIAMASAEDAARQFAAAKPQ